MSEETVIETTEETTMADLEDHFDDANPWNRVAKYQADKTPIHVTISGVVTGGVIAMVEGLRGFIPASKVSLSYVEDLETLLNKEMDVQVIDCDPDNNRLVLSARELLRKEERRKGYGDDHRTEGGHPAEQHLCPEKEQIRSSPSGDALLQGCYFYGLRCLHHQHIVRVPGHGLFLCRG